MKTDKLKQAKDILEYWYLLEMLNQEDYPNYKEIKDKVENHKGKERERILKGEEKKCSFLEDALVYKDIPQMSKFLEDVKEEVSACNFQSCGNITVLMGKVPREDCLNEIAANIASAETSPDRIYGKIALMALQIDLKGNYVQNTLSISPVLWAFKQIKQGYLLSTDAYNAAINHIEEKILFFPDGYYEDLENSRDDILVTLYNYIKQEFASTLPVETSCSIEFTCFDEQETEEDYYGLQRNYFSEDINLILDKINKNDIKESLLEYIVSENFSNEHKYNLVQDKYREDYYQCLSKVLSINKFPVGKWPSKYSPALMQQFAINAAINEDHNTIFSVNGPPGTGKTTLIKEIVANNIVERAKLLAQNNKADAAFDKRTFSQQYPLVYNDWYVFKEDAINDYGILVVSNNNTAAENISKEFPKSLIKDLTEFDIADVNEREQLDEIRELFVPESGDIFFTDFARKLFASDDAWGLISAPLGKKVNISSYYNKALYPLFEQIRSNNDIESHEALFTNAVKAFKEQCAKVDNLHSAIFATEALITKHHEILLRIREEEDKYQKTEKKFKDEKTSIQNTINTLQEKIGRLEEEINITNDDFEAVIEEVRLWETEQSSLNNKLINIYCQIESEQKRLHFWDKIFKTAKYKIIQEKCNTFNFEVKRLSKRSIEIDADLESKNTIKTNLLNRMEEYRRQKSVIKGKINTEKQKEKSNEAKLIRLKNELEMLNKEKEEIEREIAISEPLNKSVYLDTEYISRIVSADVTKSSSAHVECPWITNEYNREREKLFYLALQVTKEFVLSSKFCRTNLYHLAEYWKYRKDNNKEIVNFAQTDKTNMVKCLYQTLFLFTPVISSTLASVERLFKDVNEPDVFGMLVVDEAGMALPQSALGALYRCRKAIVVGDPRQIEPIVTDELKIIKNALLKSGKENIEKYIQDKTISVQKLADKINIYGTYMPSENQDENEWIGSPLVVHRRCISPMFDISNILSYNGIMKNKTVPPAQGKSFIFEQSCWINVAGSENGNKDHFVTAQAEKLCSLLEKAFDGGEPDIFIISPFKSVIGGLKKYIEENIENTKMSSVKSYLLDSNKTRIGTVHTFQGKEAEEVFFVLGCDTSKDSEGAIRWVNNNIVNVAASRAKYRLYIIGQQDAWNKSRPISTAKEIIERRNGSVLPCEASSVNNRA